jgi:serine/threonine protein kinase
MAGDGQQPELPAGTELGCFRITSTLGQGGMGVVYKAYDTSLDRHVALKVLSPSLTRNDTFIERFHREAKACGKLSHPNITHIYSISGTGEAYHYFAMEYVEGQNLAERVRDNGPFPVDKALEICRQTALGLREAAAAGIIHRDIKPSNLLLTSSRQVKITDFGLAKARAAMGHTLDLTTTGVVMGTPLYMSPEQGRGGNVDHRSDIYSLGATLFFLVYGCPPFEADSPIALILKHINDPVSFPTGREISPSVKELLLRMLHKGVNRRVQSYDDLLKDLDTIRAGGLLTEETSTRVIVLRRAERKTGTGRKSGIFSTSGLKATKLSVARTNIKLGRREKAVSLLSETIKDGDPGLRAEAALLLLSIYEKDEDLPKVRQMCEIVLADPPGSSSAAYVAWKLATLDESDAIDKTRQALARYEAILADAPADLPREVIEAQVLRLKTQIADAVREGDMTQIVLRSKSTTRRR